ncbi:MAG TPA: HpcH/HpaI aldolase/citrate lyase family protein, partial [Nakamurella sp.]
MRHFDQLAEAVRRELFHSAPESFDRASDREVLAHALGATLYVPATRSDLAATVRRRAERGARSMVIDLEDAISDPSVDGAVASTADVLAELGADPPESLLFVRVRSAAHIRQLTLALGPGQRIVSGFVLPKFGAKTGEEYLQAVVEMDARSACPVYAMPVLETREVLYRETRDAELVGIRELLDRYRPHVLSVRLGATDLCGLFGIRRDRDLSIYDVGVAADLITQVVNQLGRTDGTGFAITGPVWEYFANHERILRPQLRQTPFADRHADDLRSSLMSRDLDGLMREIILDRANGLTGKSVIHPSHIAPVHALAVVPHEEYLDALDIVRPESASGGVRASGYGNKLNEMRPHRIWAERTLLRARMFGSAAAG